MCKVPSLARFVKTRFKALVLARGNVILGDVQRCVLHRNFIVDSLNFVLLHFLSYCSTEILRPILRFILHLLDLNFGGFIIQPKTIRNTIELTPSLSKECKLSSEGSERRLERNG